MPLHLETTIHAKFIMTNEELTPEKEASLNALNAHAHEIAERLQATFRLLITEMLDLKREKFTKEN